MYMHDGIDQLSKRDLNGIYTDLRKPKSGAPTSGYSPRTLSENFDLSFVTLRLGFLFILFDILL